MWHGVFDVVIERNVAGDTFWSAKMTGGTWLSARGVHGNGGEMRESSEIWLAFAFALGFRLSAFRAYDI